MSNLFDIKMVFTQIPDLLTYLPVTLELAVVSMIVSLILGLILALIKMKKIPVLKQIANLYISVIRGTPVLVQLYVTYFGIPMILKAINLKYGTNYNANGVAPIIYAFIALAVNESAYNAEVIRASLESVPKGQIEAANALGMTYFQALRRVILPELLPPLLTGTGLAFGRCLGEYGSVVFIAGNRPYETEITPLIIMSELQEFDYKSATSIALVMLVASFLILFLMNLMQARNSKRLRGGNA